MGDHITLQDLKAEYGNEIPPYFDPSKLPQLDDAKVVYFDEIHIEQQGGATAYNGMQVRFPRDAAGRYDPTSKTFNHEQKQTTFKYPQQACLCIGVAKVRLVDGTYKGR